MIMNPRLSVRISFNSHVSITQLCLQPLSLSWSQIHRSIMGRNGTTYFVPQLVKLPFDVPHFFYHYTRHIEHDLLYLPPFCHVCWPRRGQAYVILGSVSARLRNGMRTLYKVRSLDNLNYFSVSCCIIFNPNIKGIIKKSVQSYCPLYRLVME
jgi:hypothetical protein